MTHPVTPTSASWRDLGTARHRVPQPLGSGTPEHPEKLTLVPGTHDGHIMSIALAPHYRGHVGVGNREPRWRCIVDDPATAEIPIVLGTKLGGGPLVLDVGRWFPSMLIARTPGSAPDHIMRLVLTSVLRCSPTSIQVVLVDPGGSLVDLSGDPSVVRRVTSSAEIADALSWAEGEIHRRYGWCADLSVRSYNALRGRLVAEGRGAEVPPRLVVLLADALDADRGLVERIAWTGRAAGVHLLVSIAGDEWVAPFGVRLLLRDRSAIGLADLVELCASDRFEPAEIAYLGLD